VLRGIASLTGAIVVMIVAFLFLESLGVLSSVGPWRFVSDGAWHPTTGQFDLTHMLLGTVLVTGGAVLLATPLGIASALFCRFYAPAPVARVYGRLIEILAGIPSVIYGLWGLMVLVPLIGSLKPPGPSLLAGILILTIMIVPTIALFSDAALREVPERYIQGATALGLSRWGMVRGVVLPAARSGLFTGVLLGMGRAIGETMAVLMVCGNVVQAPGSLFDPIRPLTANIALEMGYALGDHRAALFVSGLFLMGIVVVLVSAAEVAGRRAHG
jgi:phosphate transport system permease protein